MDMVMIANLTYLCLSLSLEAAESSGHEVCGCERPL